MHVLFEKLETLVDRLIPPALILVLLIIVMELLFPETAHHYDEHLNMADSFVILIFATDLSFKLNRAKTWEGFLRDYWLEIIAIMPLFFVFRMIELVFVTRTAEVGQDAVHLGTRTERVVAAFRSPEAARSARFGRFIRAFSRSPRFAKAAEFFGHPDE